MEAIARCERVWKHESRAYALAVSCQEQVEVQGERKRVASIADGLAPEQWHRLSVGDGSKGPRQFDWARVQLGKPEQEGWQRYLLIRRSLVVGEKPAERAYVLVFAPSGTTLAEMATAIGTRWTVEQCFQEGKGEVGLDHYEVRSWHGWYRHITLCMLAHAFLVVLRIQSQHQLPQTEQTPEKKHWEPSVSLSTFKHKRGLACP